MIICLSNNEALVSFGKAAIQPWVVSSRFDVTATFGSHLSYAQSENIMLFAPAADT